MTEPSAAVLEQLAQATERRAAEQQPVAPAAPQPRPPKEPTLPVADATPDGAPAAGTATAKYMLVDHFFGGSTGTLWAYDGATWRAKGTAEPPDEQAIAQVAFAANRVDVWWDNNDALTIVRCWKYL